MFKTVQHKEQINIFKSEYTDLKIRPSMWSGAHVTQLLKLMKKIREKCRITTTTKNHEQQFFMQPNQKKHRCDP